VILLVLVLSMIKKQQLVPILEIRMVIVVEIIRVVKMDHVRQTNLFMGENAVQEALAVQATDIINLTEQDVIPTPLGVLVKVVIIMEAVMKKLMEKK